MLTDQDKALLVGALSKCVGNKEMLESAFTRFEVEDLQLRIDCMNECMGNPITFYSAGEENISIQNKYNMTVLIFLEGSWKLAEELR